MMDSVSEPILPGLMPEHESQSIAIIGMAGRFPGAANVAEFWQNVRAGRDCISHFGVDELEDAFTDGERSSPDYVPARPVLPDVDQFDAEFFGMYPREAALTDPQHRIFLEICWEALEAGGYAGLRDTSIGVFAGCSMSTYFLHNVLSDRAKIEDFTSKYQVGNYPMLVGALTDTLATRVSYKLNLKGPAVTLHTACSTSLFAVAQACQSLLLYQADMALAGGVSITFPQRRGYIHQEGGMVSPDGKCRPFDAAARGTVFGSGAGVILMKRVGDAIADGDTIHAVIRGCGTNNDGSDKIGFTAPSVRGQAAAIAVAHAEANVDARSIGYVECHGTATPLGDPIEFNALANAFDDGLARESWCALGSAKANVGHLDAAAGITGLIKAVMTLREGEIPPLVHFATPNPYILLNGSPFYVPTSLTSWPRGDEPRRAGVSAFGVGGTNVHIVLEEAPERRPAIEGGSDAVRLLPLSARSDQALVSACVALADALEADATINLDDVSHTLQRGRRPFPHRALVTASSAVEAVAALRSPQIRTAIAADAPRVHFLFPGQGCQYVGMGRDLYGSDREFSSWIDRGCEQIRPAIDVDLRALLFAGDADETDSEALLKNTRYTQPALFLIEYALAKAWEKRGVRPQAMIGHSVGEFVAAAIAGVMSFEEALRLVTFRGRLMNEQPSGAMLAVRAPARSVLEHLPDDVDLAAINAPELCVVAGQHAAIDSVEAALAEKGFFTSRLHTSHAFHSAMMDGVVAQLRDEARKINLCAPQISYVSCVTGHWITDAEACSPDYWATHCRATVDFAGAIETLRTEGRQVLLEVGPGRTLSTFANQAIGRDPAYTAITSLCDQRGDETNDQTMTEAVGRLWLAGLDVDWNLAGATAGRRIPLPTYGFQRKRHWIDAPPPDRTGTGAGAGQVAIRSARTPEPVSPSEPQQSPRPTLVEDTAMPFDVHTPTTGRITELRAAISTTIEDLADISLAADDVNASFLDLGFDSLFLGQLAQKLQKQLGIKLTFRQLLGPLPSIAALADHLDREMPASAQAEPTPSAAPAPAALTVPASAPTAVSLPQAALQSPGIPVMVPEIAHAPAMPAGSVEGLFQLQLQAMQQVSLQQIAVFQGGAVAAAATPFAAPQAATPNPIPVATVAAAVPSSEARPQALDEAQDDTWRGRITPPPVSATQNGDITKQQAEFLVDLAKRYSVQNAQSKSYTAANRRPLADPRAVAGFRAEWKEMIFPVVARRSKGSKLWDLDGNEYIDLVNGYGQTAFGHAPDFVLDAISRQMEEGFAIGPQSPLSGEVAALVCELTGHERATFCNTGSEAVMAAMRVARTVTGRERVVVFANDYHGQFDEVLVKGRNRTGSPSALPIAPGIPTQSVANMTVLTYDDPKSLDWIASNAEEIAAVVFEPVQSRHPELRPLPFVRALRKLTEENDIALVFDEVVTGFRTHAGGMQGLWGIHGDMASYGKVVGGGMPIGILAGSSRFMDALDGGHWSYGDTSVPEIAPTFFAGTFVRHPLVLAAAHSVLTHVKNGGADLHQRVASRTATLVDDINGHLALRGIDSRLETFSSWFMINFSARDRYGPLFFAEMRMRGIHVQDGFPCFLTTAHSEADFQAIAEAFRQSVDALQAAGFMAGNTSGDSVEAAKVAAAAECPLPAALETPLDGDIPLTEAQTEIWLAAQLGEAASCAFNESVSLRLSGPLDRTALSVALNKLIARHDTLRQRFAPDGASFRIMAPEALDFGIIAADDWDGEARLRSIIEAEAATPFDLTEGWPFRVELVALAEREHVLVLTAHHIVCDGWSFNILVDDLAKLYSTELAGSTLDLPELYPFSRFAADHTAKGSDDEKIEAYWLSRFTDIPVLPELPLDRPRPAQRSFRGGTAERRIDAETYVQIKKTGAREGCTLFTTLFCGLQIMIGRLSERDDVVLGVPTAGQSLVEDRSLTGHCVNFLPIRSRFEAGQPVGQYLKTARKHVLDAFENQEFTYGTLVRKLDLRRDQSRLPLTEIQFNLERISDGLAFGDVRAEMTPNPKAFVNFDLFFNIIESSAGLRIDADFNSDIFDRPTVEHMLEQYETILRAMAENPDMAIADLPLVAAGERQWLCETLNETQKAYPSHQTIADRIARTVAEKPDAIAARFGEEQLSYGELESRCNRLARHLQSIVPATEARIAVALDRSLDMLVALIAVMKSGHAYVPLDPRHPASRLTKIIETARVSALICDDDEMVALGTTAERPVIRLSEAKAEIDRQDDQPLPDNHDGAGDRTAYVIFTSGSTGEPKGVEVSHRSVVNFLTSMAERPGFRETDILVAVTTISFDIAALELFLPLVTGGLLVIADREDVTNGFGLVRLINQTGATIVQATPTLWSMLLEAGLKPDSRMTMLCGGEPMTRALANDLIKDGGTLWNMYGPTETTVWSSLARIRPGNEPIAIGDPIANTRLYVLDERGVLLPTGATGELCIAGDGLAQGYFDHPDLTRDAFVDVVIAPGREDRVYRTGDLARRNTDGTLTLLGRRDQQIKLRGFRIELGEIETHIARFAGIAACAVDLKETAAGTKQMVGYYTVAKGCEVVAEALAQHVSIALPDYMTPVAWVPLGELPKTGNGKLDRKALPLPREATVAPIRLIEAPTSPLEQSIHDIWRDVLKVETLGTSDNIFRLGADSLTIFRIAARMLDKGLGLEAKHLMMHQTIAELATFGQSRSETDGGGKTAASRPSLRDFRNGARRYKVGAS